jgi:hypothetical protein
MHYSFVVVSAIVFSIAGLAIGIMWAEPDVSIAKIERAKCEGKIMHILYENGDGSVGWYHADVPCEVNDDR